MVLFKTTDVPRPLTNDLWVFLFQTIDAECVERASPTGTYVYVKVFMVNVSKRLKPFFLEQHINIVNRVTLQSFWFIFNCIILRHYLSINTKRIIKSLKRHQNNCILKCLFIISIEANIVDPDQTAPIGAV